MFALIVIGFSFRPLGLLNRSFYQTRTHAPVAVVGVVVVQRPVRIDVAGVVAIARIRGPHTAHQRSSANKTHPQALKSSPGVLRATLPGRGLLAPGRLSLGLGLLLGKQPVKPLGVLLPPRCRHVLDIGGEPRPILTPPDVHIALFEGDVQQGQEHFAVRQDLLLEVKPLFHLLAVIRVNLIRRQDVVQDLKGDILHTLADGETDLLREQLRVIGHGQGMVYQVLGLPYDCQLPLPRSRHS